MAGIGSITLTADAVQKLTASSGSAEYGLTLAVNPKNNHLALTGKDGLDVVTTNNHGDWTSSSGIFYFVPVITSSVTPGNTQPTDETKLRNGGTLTQKKATFTFSYGQTPSVQKLEMTVFATDYAINPNTFMGDRPLNDPGYSAFKLLGSVGVGSGNANNAIDVYRVEQRLAYLGYPAMGSGYKTSGGYAANNTVYGVAPNTVNGMPVSAEKLQEFTVNGKWVQADADAEYLFYKVINYGVDGRMLSTSGRPGSAHHVTDPGAYFGSIETAAAGFATNPQSNLLNWLNAYNAPHWMQIGQVAGWRNTQTGSPPSSRIENYGTSWLRDLMVAKNYAPTAFRQPNSLFNGATDANHAYTPFEHASHDLGMAMDLGIANYITDTHFYGNAVSQEVRKVVQPPLSPGHWSNSVAEKFVGAMIHDPNRWQDLVLADFLSLYAVTQKGANGSRDALAAHITGSSNSSDQEKELNALFGDGTQENGLINGVIIGGKSGTKDTYPDMRWALTQLGFRGGPLTPANFVGKTNPAVHTLPSLSYGGPHYNHFHIYLQPPKAEPIHTANLLLASNTSALPDTVATEDVLNLADATVKSITPAIVRKIEKEFTNTCAVSENQSYVIGYKASGGGLSPAGAVLSKLKYTYGIDVAGAVKTIVTQAPLHGQISMIGLATRTIPGTTFEEFQYTPEKDFIGDDKVTFEVTVNGQKFRISYVVHVQKELDEEICRPAGEDRGDLEPQVQIALENIEPLIDDTNPNGLQNWLISAALDGMIGHPVTIDFQNLPGSAVAQTTGEAPNATITLDTNAANYGWFIDPTPADNAEFLPTANPDVWMAKAGTDAAGKMDMLSVLLHEYGHALGLDHSANPNDFMSPNLQPGERRLPSAAELTLMSQLAAQLNSGNSATALASSTAPAPTSPAAPVLPIGTALSALLIGRLRRTDYGALSPVITSAQIPAPQFELAINATLTNNNFAGGTTRGKPPSLPITGYINIARFGVGAQFIARFNTQ